MNSLIKLYEILGELRVKFPRIIHAKKELKEKMIAQQLKPLSASNIKLIYNLWGDIKVNHAYFSFYNRFNERFDPRYIPDNLHYTKIDPYFNDAITCKSIDDKNLYNLYFFDTIQPRTILRKINSTYLDSEYRVLSYEQAVEKCILEKSVILKKATNSVGGKDILIWSIEEEINKLKSYLNLDGDYIVQEIVDQHSSVGDFHPYSLNTIRIITLFHRNKVRVLSSILRMGANGNFVDNAHAGGIFCGINSEGKLNNHGFNMKGDCFTKHPTGVSFDNRLIHNFEHCLDLVTRIAPRLVRFSRLTSWDLAIRKDGIPILIEANLAYGQIDFHQMTNGPLFGDLTKEIIDEVLKKKTRIQ